MQAQMAFEMLAGVLLDEDATDDAVRKTTRRTHEVNHTTLG